MSRFFSFVSWVLMAGSLAILSCKDPCDKLDCGAFGSCLEGDDDPICVCDNGYEKDDLDLCEIRATTKFVGNWEVSAVCVEQKTFRRDTTNYVVSITEDPESVSIFQIRIANLGNLDDCPSGGGIDPVLARVSFNRVTIQPLTFCPNPATSFSGYEFVSTTGNYDTQTEELALTYRVKWSQPDPTTGQIQLQDWLCQAVLTRQ